MADEAPALYVYEQRGAGWVQRGLIGLVAVGTDAVHPHEGVMAGPVAGRRELMKATRSNLEPILLVYNGGAGVGGHGGPAGPGATGTTGASASTLTDRAADGGAPLAQAETDDGITHRLWAVTDPAAHRAIAADLANRTALIADGHHRYAAYRELRTEMRASGAGPAPGTTAWLSSSTRTPTRCASARSTGCCRTWRRPTRRGSPRTRSPSPR